MVLLTVKLGGAAKNDNAADTSKVQMAQVASDEQENIIAPVMVVVIGKMGGAAGKDNAAEAAADRQDNIIAPAVVAVMGKQVVLFKMIML